MNHQGTAREVLIAEAIGDLAKLLDRIEALQPTMRQSTRALIEARAQLGSKLDAFDANVTALGRKAQGQVATYIVERTEEATRGAVGAQTRAMTEAAQKLFEAELDPALQRLAKPLQDLVHRLDRPWENWLTHAATAAVSSILTLAIAAWLWTR